MRNYLTVSNPDVFYPNGYMYLDVFVFLSNLKMKLSRGYQQHGSYGTGQADAYTTFAM